MAGPANRIAATVRNGVEVLRFGGLQTGTRPSPFQTVERCDMYRLRRYFAGSVNDPPRPPVILVPPMMMSANIFDVTRDQGAVGVLHDLGVDPWVVDFGSPDREAGGLERTLSDHVVALSRIVDSVHAHTGQKVHLAGYSQGGMFCYQTAAYRRSEGLASIVTFGSAVDSLGGLPFGIPAALAGRGAQLVADHIFNRLSVSGWMARTGFQLLDPIKTIRARWDFLRQLHDREALLPREQQRRFLEVDGWVAWSGPAVAELLRQFVVHNRMMAGGAVIDGTLITLAEITCPVLAFIGEIDDIGQPASVRGIRQAAPRADVSEVLLQAGHFGLVVGSTAATHTWPTVGNWVLWKDGRRLRPQGVLTMGPDPSVGVDGATGLSARIGHSAGVLTELSIVLSRGLADSAVWAVRSGTEIAGEAARTVPRLARLGRLQPHTRVSLGRLITERANRAPGDECFLFEDRVHTNAMVENRIDDVVRGLIAVGVRQGAHIGVLMDTSPGAVVAIAALSRLGAVAVLLPPDRDLAGAVQLCEVADIVADPHHVAAAVATGARVLTLNHGRTADLRRTDSSRIVELDCLDLSSARLPKWYRPNPGRACDLAFVFYSTMGGRRVIQEVTNNRWALSAYGTATAAALDRRDTIYCPTPLHHPLGLMVGLGGAVAGGSRIALTPSVDPTRFADEVHRYGVTVVTYTGTMLRELVDAASPELQEHHPIRLFIGAGMPTGLWHKVTDRFAPAQILECYASVEGDAVLANISGSKVGAKGRPLPGSTEIRLGGYDAATGRFIEDDNGFVRACANDEVGVLLAKALSGPDAARGAMRSVFAEGDTWVTTDHLFRRDYDGDYWFVDNRSTVIQSALGPVFCQPICDALGEVMVIDMAVVYPVATDTHDVAVAALMLDNDGVLTSAALTAALGRLPGDQRPAFVQIVDHIPLTPSYRPLSAALQSAGLPAAGETTWYYDRADGNYRQLTTTGSTHNV
ncbi:AMP-binding protein [Mycobacterium kubicae]|uniref:AMP-binding protein n=2 Tax=Mycobacterium kubicae TaxID=120959 RepID=A0AAX1JIA9_9MYCO|nr:AMP-binding protein [Mycobacterium kubicae]MCV7093641.1 AMP-binding protein [Mycobacterium kubicae]ORV96098.1 acyl-CoA synthetase [Mycobacterium kubicae]QNI11988.1 AMP-binding protein [Mycobacterium kubicae]QPI40214.1 AMP-binding protein [Mycobacterium kubicae]